VGDPEMRRVSGRALKKSRTNGHRPGSLFDTETKLVDASYSKGYYEPVEPAMIFCRFPAESEAYSRSGAGKAQWRRAWPTGKLQVVAVPLDPVIFGAAEGRDIEVV